MAKPQRLDAELVRRHLVSSRADAKRLVQEGKVLVGGIPATKPDAMVADQVAISLATGGRRFVSRGGEKLDGALERLEVNVAGRRWLDAGASTGGFTDCLLQRGAAAVVAADVGYGQLDWALRRDPRVTVMERINVRHLTPDDLPWPPDGVVADLSFISLALVLPSLHAVARADADFVLLVKPQFEAGKEAVGKGGVVRDPAQWRRSLESVASAGAALELGVAGAVVSPLRGPAGNVEFFLHLRRGAEEEGAIAAALREVA